MKKIATSVNVALAGSLELCELEARLETMILGVAFDTGDGSVCGNDCDNLKCPDYCDDVSSPKCDDTCDDKGGGGGGCHPNCYPNN